MADEKKGKFFKRPKEDGETKPAEKKAEMKKPSSKSMRQKLYGSKE